jgi:hypothetical protein
MNAQAFPALGFDPAPGDPAATREVSRAVGLLARQVAQAAGTLSGARGEDWTGLHADAFRAHLRDDVTPLIQTAAHSFEKAATALNGWASLLDGFAEDARVLERRAEAVQQDVRANFQNGASRANSELAEIRHRAEDLHSSYLTAATRIANQLILAGNMAPKAPGLFASLWHDVASGWDDVRDDVGNWVRAHVALLEFLSSVLNMVAMVAGLLALIPPLSLIFGWVALGAAGAATISDGLLATFAHASWTTFALDAVGTASGISVIKASAELTKIFEETGRTTQMWKVIKVGVKEVKVAPGLFRSIAHMNDEAWAMKGGVKEFGWRVIDTVCGQVNWTTTGIAATTIPGTIGTWYRDFLTGKQPWSQPASG